jgi:hypothetical protein
VSVGNAHQARWFPGGRCRRGMEPHIFLAVLVHGEVDGAKRAAAYLLPDEVLVDAVLGGAVVLRVAVLGARVEGFLSSVSGDARGQWQGHGGRGRTLTLRVDEAARLWCRSGEW